MFIRNALFITCLLLFFGCKKKSVEYIHNEGFIFGTTYSLIYQSEKGDLHEEIRQALFSLNKSLSPFDTSSIISQFNKGKENVVADSFFIDVFTKSIEINRISDGVFDITLAPLINAWGFGFEKYNSVNQGIIDSLLQYVGMKNVYIEKDTIKRKKDGIMLNASAIAKGYGVDVIANLLKSNGVKNFMVEIGGEISTNGVNRQGKAWRIAIDKPVFDKNPEKREFKMFLKLSGQSVATSGNYRNFFIKDGKIFGHTIDPRTGYPVQLSVLSSTIVANNCMTADAYATVCLVIGLEQSLKLIENTPEIEGAFIYELTECGLFGVAYSSGFEQYIEQIF